jgi:hypothetical protein
MQAAFCVMFGRNASILVMGALVREPTCDAHFKMFPMVNTSYVFLWSELRSAEWLRCTRSCIAEPHSHLELMQPKLGGQPMSRAA